MNVESIINEVEQAAADRIKPEQGDYIVDGLLFCGKCQTPKQVRVTFFGHERTPYCLCKCAAEQREREEKERKRREHELRIQEKRKAGFPDKDLINCTFANDDHANEKISNVAQRYAANFDSMLKDGKGLLLFGGVGTGKTFTAACIANALIDKGYDCLVTNFARLINTISGMYAGKQEYIDSLNAFDLLIIDDLAAERDTEYMNEIVYNIVDSRYRAGLPMIITTNLTADELKNPADVRKQRVYSRLLEICIPIEVTGDDRRRTRLKRDFSEYKNILGL